MYPTENNTHRGADEFEERNDGKPPHVVIMMPDTPPQSILKPKSNGFWTKKRIVCAVVAIFVLIGCGVGGAIWYFYPREKESTSTSSSMHATSEKKSSSPKLKCPTDEKAKQEIQDAKRYLDELTGQKTLKFGGTGKDSVISVNINGDRANRGMIFADINDPVFMAMMQSEFKNSFDSISIEIDAAKRPDYTTNFFVEIRQMLKHDGIFTCPLKDKKMDTYLSIKDLLTSAEFSNIEDHREAASGPKCVCNKSATEWQMAAENLALKTKSKPDESTVLRFGGVDKGKDAFVVNMNKFLTFGDGKKVDAIIGDFNDEIQMGQMAEAFPQKFNYIMFDGDAAKYFDGEKIILKSIKKMMKQNGKFIYEMKKDAEDIDIRAIKKKLQSIGFNVTHEDNFNYNGHWHDAVGRWKITGNDRRHTVLICKSE